MQIRQGQEIADRRRFTDPAGRADGLHLLRQYVEIGHQSRDHGTEPLARVRRREVQREPVEYGRGAGAHDPTCVSVTTTLRTHTCWAGPSGTVTFEAVTRTPSSISSTR